MTIKNSKFFHFALSFFILISIVFIFGALSAMAQTDDERIAQLQQQIAALEQEAQKYRGNIASEQEKAQSLSREINILKGQINATQTKITQTQYKIDKAKIEIGTTEVTISDVQGRIDGQKDTIGDLLLIVHKRDSETLLTTLLKHESLSTFFNQAQQLSEINTKLLEVVEGLKQDKADLEQQRQTLEGQKIDLEDLNVQQAAERNSLTGVKTERDSLLKATKGQEAQYQKLLSEVERKQQLFFTELKELETKTIQGGLYLLHVKAAPIPPKGTKLFIWPEDGYRLTQGYGMTTYARRGAYGGAPHNGLDMASGYGSPIMAAADGAIVANGKNDGWGNWVAVQHPNNLVTLYAHMSAFEFLRVGTVVKQGQTIGYEGTTGNVTGSHLHFSVYAEFFTYVNAKNGQLYFNYFDGTVDPRNYL